MDASAMKDKNILVIDDDITALDLISYIFEDRGYTVHRATDGQSALDNVKRLAPKLIIVDLMMPGINGVETIRQIRQLGFGSEPIIAFTAVDDTSHHDEATAAGANIVVTKPCPTATLLKHVKSFLHD
jgi:CheY-like chemotaxis protein